MYISRSGLSTVGVGVVESAIARVPCWFRQARFAVPEYVHKNSHF